MTIWQADYEAPLARVSGPGRVEPAHAAKMRGLELLTSTCMIFDLDVAQG